MMCLTGLAAPKTTTNSKISLLGHENPNLTWKVESGDLVIQLPKLSKLLPNVRSQTGWVLKMTKLGNVVPKRKF